MFYYLGLFFWSRPYINFDKYRQQVKTKLIILGASRKSQRNLLY